jgi:hypothetical protein
MTFWEIREPAASDYKHVHLSGKLEHPYRLPAVECEKCGTSVCRYYDVVLPFECPVSFRENHLLTDREVCVSVKEFKKCVKKLASSLPKSARAKLTPEACLQPGFLNVPSIPKDDFLWSDLWSGLSSMVVSERVQQEIERLAPVGIDFHPVTIRGIGRRSSKSPPRIPASGEPEDIMQEFKVANTSPSVPTYYQMLVSAESDYPPGARPGSVCNTCGEEEAPDWRAKDIAWKNLTSRMVGSMTKGLDLFRIPERGTVYVSDRVKSVLETLGATNVSFRSFPPEPVTPRQRTSKTR